VGAAGTLRVNVLEQCQLRCAYCLPGAVKPFTPNPARLRVDEYRRLAAAFGAHGLRKVRFTGGEPLLHPELEGVIAAFRAGLPQATLAVTTNGLLLPSRLEALARAGLDAATVHIDSLRPDRYRQSMGDGDLEVALQAVAMARARLARVKLNCVVQKGLNDDELWSFLALSRRLDVEVRFIELMNTGSATHYTRGAFVSGARMLALLAEREPIAPLRRRHEADPAALYRTGSGITFGVIASDTAPFCGACDRLRLTPDGRLRGCLYEAGGTSLRDALRGGATDAALEALVGATVHTKRSFHPASTPGLTPFSMSEAGG